MEPRPMLIPRSKKPGTFSVEQDLANVKVIEVNGEPVELASSGELIRLLECPICTDLPIAPIYNCELGHSICYKCRQKTKKCPTCSRGFTTARNFLAESIAATAKVTCAYKDKGCKIITTIAAQADHNAVCEFKPVLCNLTKNSICAGAFVDFAAYFPHLIGTHGVAGLDTEFDKFCDKIERVSIINDGAKWPPFYIRIQDNDKDQVFLKHTTFINGNLYWWLALITPLREEADNFHSNIVIQLSKDMEFRYSVPVHHFRKTPEAIVESGQCASVPFKSVIPLSRSEIHGGIDYPYCWDMKFSVSKKNPN